MWGKSQLFPLLYCFTFCLSRFFGSISSKYRAPPLLENVPKYTGRPGVITTRTLPKGPNVPPTVQNNGLELPCLSPK